MSPSQDNVTKENGEWVINGQVLLFPPCGVSPIHQPHVSIDIEAQPDLYPCYYRSTRSDTLHQTAARDLQASLASSSAQHPGEISDYPSRHNASQRSHAPAHP